MGTGLEDDIAFGIEDESAHIGDDGAAVGQEHAKDQADEGLAAVGEVVEGLSVLDLPESDAVGGNRPLDVAVDLGADGVAGGVVQDLNGPDAAEGRAMRRGPTWGPSAGALKNVATNTVTPLVSLKAVWTWPCPGSTKAVPAG